MRASVIPWLGLLCGVGLALFLGLETEPGPAVGRGELVERVLREVERSHVREVDGDALLHDGLDRMLRSLDRNSRYYSPAQVSDFEQDTEGFIVGIGVVVGTGDPPVEDPEAPGLPLVTAVVEDGPAAEAGVRAGDRILTAAGESLAGRTVEDATGLIKGQEGTTVVLELRGLDGSSRTVVVPRRRVAIPSVGEVAIHRPATGSPVGLVRLVQFQPGSTEEVRAAIAGLVEAGARSVVLDLRGDGGGLLDEAIGIASLFLESGLPVVRTVGRSRTAGASGVPAVTEEVFRARSPAEFPELPVAVLIDGNSASASEIVAAALRDHRRAPLIGEESFGKWTVQDVISLGPGARDGIVKITTQSFHPPDGGRVRQEDGGPRGLVPDVPVEIDGTLRTRLYRAWYDRHLDRINAPLAVRERPLPTAVEPTEAPESDARPDPPDPAAARAIDLLASVPDLSTVLAPELAGKPAGDDRDPPGGSEEGEP